MSLDAFFSAASRFARHPSAGRNGKIEELLRAAPGLLASHPDRGLEIALSVQRLRLHDTERNNAANAHALRFAAQFAQTVCEQLPAPGEALTSRAQAQQALISYVTLLDLGAASALRQKGAPALSSAVTNGAQMLDTPALIAGLSKVGVAGEPEVVAALQISLANESRLEQMSPRDLLAVVSAVARAVRICPESSSTLLRTLDARLDMLTFPEICDACRVAAELSARQEALMHDISVQFLSKVWPLLSKGLASTLADVPTSGGEETGKDLPGETSLVQTLVAMARLVTSLTPGDEIYRLLSDQVLKPCAPPLLDVVRQQSELYEVAAPLLHSTDGPWAAFLSHLALEGLPRMTVDGDGAERILALVESIAEASAGRPSFPPFFDFALEELLQRFSALPPGGRAPQRAIKLISRIHLERPDLLGPAVPVMLSTAYTADILRSLDVSELALRLSGLASLYGRVASELGIVASRPGGSSESAASLESALVSILSTFEDSALAIEPLLVDDRQTDEEGRRAAIPSRDSICLAISAFTQVASQSQLPVKPAAGVEMARKQLMYRGRELLESASVSWQREATELSDPQIHIFLAAFRTLCIGPGLPHPLPATITALEAQRLVLLTRAAGGQREARLCLAMFDEMGRDPSCPQSLRETIVGPADRNASDSAAAPTAESSRNSSAANRMRQHMKASAESSGAAWARGPAAPSTAVPPAAMGGARSFLRRWLGF